MRLERIFDFFARHLLWAPLLLLSLSSAWGGEVHLTAAVSLKEAVGEICREYARKHPEVRVVSNFGGSGSLAKQIENGAPADIFISASPEWTEYLVKVKHLDPSSVRPFTHNSLVFVGAPGKKVSSLGDLTKLDKIALGSPKSVPAGEYAIEAIRKAGLEKALEKRLVFSKDVRQSLMYAERGDVDGAFVYKTDALQGKSCRILFELPASLHSRILYPMGLTISGARNREAADFFGFLQGGEAKGVLKRYGFLVQ